MTLAQEEEGFTQKHGGLLGFDSDRRNNRFQFYADVISSSPLLEPLRVLPHGLVDGGAIVEAGVPQRVHDGHGASEP